MIRMSSNSRILEKTAEIQRLLDEINAELVVGEFKTPEAPKFQHPPSSVKAEDSYRKDELPPVQYTAPTKNELEESGVEVELLDFLDYGNRLKPLKFLGDKWGPLNEVLTANNYVWVRDGKESHWRFQSSDEAEKPSKPSPTVTSSPPNTSEVKWMVKDGDKTVEARGSDAKVWAFVKKYDRDAKKSTDEVKSENQSLYDYLKKNKEYVDGTYKYTMNKDETFFGREKI